MKVESLRVDRIFSNAEAKLVGRPPTLAKLSREEIVWIVSDYFVKEEARAEVWAEQELPKFSEGEKGDALDTMKIDSAALSGSPIYPPDDGSFFLDRFLDGEGSDLGIEKGSEDYHQLLPLFRRAKTEHLRRTIDRAEGRNPQPTDSSFAHLHGQTLLSPPPRQTVAFGKFLDDFMEYQRKEHTETTPECLPNAGSGTS